MFIHASPLLFSHTPNQSSIYSLACISRSFSIFLQLTISLPWIIYTSPSQPSLFDPSPLVRNTFAYSSANSCSLPKRSVLCALFCHGFFTLCPVDTAVQHARWTPLRSIIDSLTTYLSCYCFWNSGFQSYRPWAYLAPIPQFRVQRSYFRSSQLIIRPQSYVNLTAAVWSQASSVFVIFFHLSWFISERKHKPGRNIRVCVSLV